MTGRDVIFVFGEVLVDEFPDGQRVLGGAPFNVAWHLTGFGQETRFVSRIGDDADGELIRSAMSDWRMDASVLQRDPDRPTGSVAVTLTDGQPEYEILPNRAYDAIDVPPSRTSDCALLYHGTLALRSARSRDALQKLKRVADAPIFMDVNLRDPWWNSGLVQRLADDASWVKLNDDELIRLSGRQDDVRSLARDYLTRHGLTGIIVTLGKKGALALTDDGQLVEAVPGQAVQAVDTVGAGDAFAAVALLGLVREWPLAKTLTRAQAFASEIVKNRGAILRERDIYERFSADWRD